MDSVEDFNAKIDIDRLDEAMQLDIVKSTSSQLLLAYFVNNSKYTYIHYRALDKIDDEDILMEIAMKNKSVYWGDYKVMRISSYLDPAYYNSEKAFSKIHDRSKLIEIVKTIDHELYNLDHLEKFIDDDDTWVDIAVNANRAYHQIFAFKEIESRRAFVRALAKCDIDKLIKNANHTNDSSFKELIEQITDEDYQKYVLTDNDEDFLKNIVRTYKNSTLRVLAIAKISDADFLKEMASDENSLLRLNAVKSIHDDDFLESIALDDEDSSVRIAALKNIRDEEFLKCFVMGDEFAFVRDAALENIYDEEFLKSFYLNDDSYIRDTALENIHDEEFLKSVAANEDSSLRNATPESIYEGGFLNVCLSPGEENFNELVSMVYEEYILKAIVTDSESYSDNERFHALRNITDIDFLRNVAINDFGPVYKYASLKTGEYDMISGIVYDDFPKNLLRETMHENINNEIAVLLIEYFNEKEVASLIEEIDNDKILLGVLDKVCFGIYYCCKKFLKIRLSKITDEDLLKDVFINGEEKNLRQWAASKVDDEDFFKDIFFKSDDISARSTALKNIYDQDMLLDVAVNGEDADLKSCAIFNIADGDVLKSIYFKSDLDCQKDIIISKTDDVEVSTDYAFNGNNSRLRMLAGGRITDENVLKDLFFKESDYWARKLISKRIHDDDFFMQIITGEYDRDFKITALVSIENEENLIKVAYNFKDPEFSKDAIDLIKNESVLRDISEMIPTCESEEEIVRHARKCIYKSFFKSEAKLYMAY